MINTPIFFKSNRVGRVYLGGKLFSQFFGDDSKDGFEPEEWIASGVKAINKEQKCEKEGVSVVEETGEFFDDLLAKYPIELCGSKGKMRILVKILDSAIRLPAQAHPDKPFSRKHFNSEYGKTESWIILGTRPDAKIYFGFKDGVDRDVFEKAVDDSETDKDSMERLMEYTVPKKDDVFFVPAKTVHAIGAGCLILEVQEPSDFTIQPEHWCGDYKLNDKEMYLGLSRENALDCFDFGKAPESKVTPTLVCEESGVKREEVIGKSLTDCFVINRITLDNAKTTLSVDDSYAVYIVTEGEGKISGDGYERNVKMGDYFFMPANLSGKFEILGNITLVECY